MRNYNYKWIKTTINYLQCTKLELNDIETLSKEELKMKLKSWDTEEWKKEVQSKVSLEIYKTSCWFVYVLMLPAAPPACLNVLAPESDQPAIVGLAAMSSRLHC